MKKGILIIVLVVVALTLGGLYLFRREMDTDALTKVYGNVDIREVSLAFRVGGRLEALHFDEGERVRKDELLAELDAVPYQQQVDRATAELGIREAELQLLRNGYRVEEIVQARARLAEAEAQLRHAELSLARQEELDAGQAGTGQQLDDARTRQEQASAAVDMGRASLQLLEAGYRPEDIRKAESAVALAAAGLAEAQTRLEDTRLLAPTDGIIESRVLETGSVAGAGMPVFVMSIQESPWVRAYIPEGGLGRIHPGMPVKVETDTRPGHPYAGRIGFISPVAEFTPKSIHTEELRTNLVYRFRVVIEDPDDQLRQGMPVTVHLPTGEGGE